MEPDGGRRQHGKRGRRHDRRGGRHAARAQRAGTWPSRKAAAERICRPRSGVATNGRASQPSAIQSGKPGGCGKCDGRSKASRPRANSVSSHFHGPLGNRANRLVASAMTARALRGASRPDRRVAPRRTVQMREGRISSGIVVVAVRLVVVSVALSVQPANLVRRPKAGRVSLTVRARGVFSSPVGNRDNAPRLAKQRRR